MHRITFLFTLLALSPLMADDKPPVIPHRQEKPPGPALTPAEALARMKVPAGFFVELVASEPDIINPVAMTIDHRGRFWVVESVEYPRRAAGTGKDRIKILEDTNGDGTADKVTLFAEGLNIPSGIAVGYGGVWVSNAPDILFLQDANGDDRADKTEVIVTGFGRADTHELPNSFTWGPDGYLYGLNGVFNPSRVVYPASSANYAPGQQPWEFTCALFRIHPVTKKFELFCEGTSNPWGIAFNDDGAAFVSACVIDHLWHLTETGYYHRQGGPYPPFTWKIESIVKHKHQKAAYCGIHYFDSEAYPAEYRGKLFMGNIHGNCINVDRLSRDGSTYFGEGDPDFLFTDDAWFMPVAQKTGPDGSLYILDWYDRYHCYQDANRDPAGIDRQHGRLYRVRYQETPRYDGHDLSQLNDANLLQLLHGPNDFLRSTALRLLQERLHAGGKHGRAELEVVLQRIVLDPAAPAGQRRRALWALIGGGRTNNDLVTLWLTSDDAVIRSWGVRAAGDKRQLSEEVRRQIVQLANDPALDVRLQLAIAARKIEGLDPLPLLVQLAAGCGDDKLLPHIVWQNVHPLLETEGPRFLAEVKRYDLKQSPGLAKLLPRATERMLAKRK